MEVGNLSVVCNNKPAELISPENGWRFHVFYLILSDSTQKVKNQVGGDRKLINKFYCEIKWN